MSVKLYSVEEAAKQLGGVSKWTVQAWLSQGRLRRTKVGARTMVAQSDIDRFILDCNGNEQRMQGGSDVTDGR